MSSTSGEGDDVQHSTEPSSTSGTESEAELRRQAKVRELFGRLGRIRQYPISADDDPLPPSDGEQEGDRES